MIGFLSTHDIPAEQALFFSLCFGVIMILATLPGAVIWFFIRPASHRPAHG